MTQDNVEHWTISTLSHDPRGGKLLTGKALSSVAKERQPQSYSTLLAGSP